MGRDKKYPLLDAQKANAINMIEKLSELERYWGEALVLTSGYRPNEINATIAGARQNDSHSKCQGVDLRDLDGAFSRWLMDSTWLLKELGFWMESPQSAKNHVHLQTYPPHSGNRIFIA